MDWQAFKDQYGWIVQPALLTCVITILTLIAVVVINRVLDVMEPKVPLPEMAFRLIRRIVRYAIVVIAIALVLKLWGLDMNSVLAMIGGILAMVAIGFVAVWSLLSNTLCAFVLTAFHPFRIGDEVEIVPDNVKGKVVDLTLLYTTLKTDEGDYYQVPNNMFFQKIFRCRAGKDRVALGEQLLESKPVE